MKSFNIGDRVYCITHTSKTIFVFQVGPFAHYMDSSQLTAIPGTIATIGMSKRGSLKVQEYKQTTRARQLFKLNNCYIFDVDVVAQHVADWFPTLKVESFTNLKVLIEFRMSQLQLV